MAYYLSLQFLISMQKLLAIVFLTVTRQSVTQESQAFCSAVTELNENIFQLGEKKSVNFYSIQMAACRGERRKTPIYHDVSGKITTFQLAMQTKQNE